MSYSRSLRSALPPLCPVCSLWVSEGQFPCKICMWVSRFLFLGRARVYAQNPMWTFTRACTCMCRRICKTNLKAKLSAVMWKQKECHRPIGAQCVWDPLYSSPPSVSPSLAPSASSLGHWGEWAAILILIPLSLCGPLAKTGEWSPGWWNAPTSFFWTLRERKGWGTPRETRGSRRESSRKG